MSWYYVKNYIQQIIKRLKPNTVTEIELCGYQELIRGNKPIKFSDHVEPFPTIYHTTVDQ